MSELPVESSRIYRDLSLLHVEDSRTDHIIIKGILQNIPGCNFTTCNVVTMAEAEQALLENDFDIILLDLSLPDSTGLDSLARVHDIAPHKPIILLTGNDSEDVIIEGIRHGAQDYLPKGNVKPDLLKRTIFAAIDRKAIEEALKTSEERFELAVRGSSVGLWDWDVRNSQFYWSDRFKGMLGITDEDFIPDFSSFENRLHPEDHGRVMEALRRHMDDRHEYDIEYRLRHEKGHYVWMHTRGQAIWDEDDCPTRMAGSVDDITEKKKAEKDRVNIELQLRHAQKLEAIGQLAAGIAHEINTPIQFVGDNTRFLQDAFIDIELLLKACLKLIEHTESGQDSQPLVNEIKEIIEDIDLNFLMDEVPNAAQQSLDGIERIGSIVKAMKEFSHPGSTNKQFVDLNKSIASTITVSRNEWKYVADLKTDFDPELKLVECLPGEINQVVLNMIVNAAHAIEEKNKENNNERGFIRIGTENLGEYCQIVISDTGGGIPAEIHQKIFDPFFTTKNVGKGTGQGLAIAYSVIVDKHQGTIDIKSEKNIGTMFIIKIPIKSPVESNSAQGERTDEKKIAVC